MFQVRFGTPQPVIFHEVDANIGMDIEVRARINGWCDVEDYDKTLYENEEQVKQAIKGNCQAIFTRCLNDNWDRNYSVIREWYRFLAPLFSDELKMIGIQASTTINALSIPDEDRNQIRDYYRKTNADQPQTFGPDETVKPPLTNDNGNVKTQYRYCPNCGHKAQEGMKFCSECGAKLYTAESTPKPASNPANVPVNGFVGMGMMGMFGMMGMPQIDPKTRAFSYKTSGMAYLSGCDLTITEADGKLTASLRQTGVKPENAKTFEVDDAFFDRVTALIDKYDGDSWDGFHRRVEGALDGDSFSFSFRNGKGRTISASGYVARPAGIRAAMDEILPLFVAESEKIFPNIPKAFEKYIEEEVIAKYGESNRNVKYGDFIGQAPYVYEDPGYFNQGVNDVPAGVLGYGIFKDFPGNDERNPGYRAVVALVTKDQDEDDDWDNTGLKLQYYAMDRPGEAKLLQEVQVRKHLVRGQSGRLSVSPFIGPGRTSISVYYEERLDYGDKVREYGLRTFQLTATEMREVGSETVPVMQGEEKISAEGIERLCKLAERTGIVFVSINWENEWRRTGFIDCELRGGFVSYNWFSHIDRNNLENTTGPKGSPIEDCYITIVKL